MKKLPLISVLLCLAFLVACSEPPASPESALLDGPPSAEDYQGLTKEEWEELQEQKVQYEALPNQEKQMALEGGTIGCRKFTHLWWEESISNELIHHVGADGFGKWIKQQSANEECADIYSFADEFDIDLNTLKELITGNSLEKIYSVGRLEIRYNYFHGAISAD